MSWAMAAGTAVNVVGGMISGKKAKKAEQARAAAEQARRQTAGRANMDIDQAMAREYESYAPRMRDDMAAQYANVDNGFATGSIDPVTGQVTGKLNDQWAGQRDMFLDNSRTATDRAKGMFGQADGFYKQAGDFDPRTHAAERYGSAQALLAPGDQVAQQDLMQNLMNKGGFGLTLNTPAAAGGGSAAVNPYVGTFKNALDTRNARMSYDSLREGETYLDNILNRGNNATKLGQGLFDTAGSQSQNAQGIQDQASRAVGQAGEFSRMFTDNKRTQAGKYWDMFLQGRNLNAQGQKNYINQMWGAPNGDAGAGAQNRADLYGKVGSSLGGLFSSGAVGNFMGSYQTPNNGPSRTGLYDIRPYGDMN